MTDDSFTAWLADRMDRMTAETGAVDPQWFVDVCRLLTVDEVLDVLDRAMRARGMPEAWIDLCRAENAAEAEILAGVGTHGHR